MDIDKDRCWICKRNPEELKPYNVLVSETRIEVGHVYGVPNKQFWIPICNICEELIKELSGKYEED